MSRYSVEIKEQAQYDLKLLSKSEPKAYQKALSLIAELYDHPQTGTGKPEQLKGGGGTLWSHIPPTNPHVLTSHTTPILRAFYMILTRWPLSRHIYFRSSAAFNI